MHLELPETKIVQLEKAYAQNTEIKPSDDVSINESTDPESLGHIKSIYFDYSTGKIMINIQWYYKPKDTKITQIINSCSKKEIFSSDNTMDVEIETINGKVKVHTLDQILKLKENGEDIYFSRAKWDDRERLLEPALKQWKTDCICNAIINPDIPFKYCKVCERVLHIQCLDGLGSHQCPGCGQDL